jgi:hypothetical protein
MSKRGRPSGPEPWRRALLSGGAAAGPLFTSVFLIEGATRPDYQPRRHPVSSLALGPRGWVQVANFASAGLLYLAGAAGLARSPAPAAGNRAVVTALAATGVGLLASAAFRTDPVSGYPPGTSPAPAPPTTTGNLHNLAAVPVFLVIPAAAAVHAWRSGRRGHRGEAAYSAVTAASMLTTTGLFGAGFGQHPRFVGQAGLYQRAAIVIGCSWLTAQSLRAAGESCHRMA